MSFTRSGHLMLVSDSSSRPLLLFERTPALPRGCFLAPRLLQHSLWPVLLGHRGTHACLVARQSEPCRCLQPPSNDLLACLLLLLVLSQPLPQLLESVPTCLPACLLPACLLKELCVCPSGATGLLSPLPQSYGCFGMPPMPSVGSGSQVPLSLHLGLLGNT